MNLDTQLFRALIRDEKAKFRFTCLQCGDDKADLAAATRTYTGLLRDLEFPIPIWNRLASLHYRFGKFGLLDVIDAYRAAGLKGYGVDTVTPLLSGWVAGGLVDESRRTWFGISLIVCPSCYERRAQAAAAAPTFTLREGRSPLPAKLRMDVLMRDAYRCRYCGNGPNEGVKLHIDHIVPVAKGGRDALDNLVTACETCNLGKGTRDVV